MTQNPTPKAIDGAPCMAQIDTADGLYICNAAPGHPGDHAAYAGEKLCHTWPQAYTAELDGTEISGRNQ